MSIRRGVWIYLFCFSLFLGFAQQNKPAGQPEPASVPPGGANRRITLDVVVADKSGKPIPGLQQEDFTLLDNKLPQKIVSFRAVEGGAATADPPVEVILLVDEVNTPFTRVAYAREQIEKFLRRDGGTLPHPVSIVFVSNSGMVALTSSQEVTRVLRRG